MGKLVLNILLLFALNNLIWILIAITMSQVLVQICVISIFFLSAYFVVVIGLWLENSWDNKIGD